MMPGEVIASVAVGPVRLLNELGVKAIRKN